MDLTHISLSLELHLTCNCLRGSSSYFAVPLESKYPFILGTLWLTKPLNIVWQLTLHYATTLETFNSGYLQGPA